MRLRSVVFFIFAGLATWGVVHAQKPFKEYDGFLRENDDVPLPPDWDQPGEFVRARLKYTKVHPLHPPQWDTSMWGWGTDYPQGDRHFLQGIRRLTLINARSVEQVVELDNSDDIYNWPFLYGVELGHWHLYQEEADQLRDYLERGGFFMTDDFHGTIEWENFMKYLYEVFPTRQVVDLDNSHPVFHVLYDLEHRPQIPGAQFLGSGKPYEFDGFEPKWRAVLDDKGRIMVAICHNMDISDAIEWSDNPRYPAESAQAAYRISANYVVYALSH